ncbi:DUF6289 family protein [Cognatiluteimonas weifangensis]|uniref:DUF6289 family protein n=1 Tax=Cognatiluteimonas weifangensis TaxID=2303539 RepID=UPI0011C0CC3D|nr:DUF6289 family protein [Luteimonas weifangensis]
MKKHNLKHWGLVLAIALSVVTTAAWAARATGYTIHYYDDAGNYVGYYDSGCNQGPGYTWGTETDNYTIETYPCF